MDDVFEFLRNADEQLEKHGNAIEAATKYYEAVYLMRQYMARIPKNSSEKNRSIYDLLQEKIAHYENVASTLLRQPATLSPTSEKSTAISSDNLSVSQLSIHSDRICRNDDTRSPLSRCAFVANNWNDNYVSPTPTERRNPNNSPRSQNSTNSTKVHGESVHYLNQQATLVLSQAVDEDESMNNSIAKRESTCSATSQGSAVIAKYMEAAELFLKALQKLQHLKMTTDNEYSNNQIDAVIKQRLQHTLDRVEELKLQQSQRHQTTDVCVSVPHQRREQYSTTISVVDATLTTHETQILEQSSLIASGLFLPWSDVDATRFNTECCEQRNEERKSETVLFTDPSGFLTLSTKQKERFYAWARPHEIMRIRRQQNNILSSLKLHRFSSDPSSGTKEGCSNIVMMQPATISPGPIQQKYVADSSFIASLCTCANYERKYRIPLLSSILYPQAKDVKTDKQMPVYNPLGKYMVKLWFNGTPRCVIVDDYFPIDKDGNLLCSQTTSCNTSSSKLELWVCLIEKAYMKICGGYNLSASNSEAALFSLTGWIPEHIYLSSHNPTQNDQVTTKGNVLAVSSTARNTVTENDTLSEQAWERIYSASSYCDCVITASTRTDSHCTSNTEKMNKVGLVTCCSYAVLSVVQTTNGERLLQLKSPLVQPSWKGRYSCFDNQTWSNRTLCNELRFDPAMAKKQDDGVFWICWDDILHYFQDFYLSWNPKSFSKSHILHGHWSQSQGPTDDTFNVGENPQYVITLSDQAIQKKATLWILLSRHITTHEDKEVNNCLTVHVHRTGESKERVWYAGHNSNCILVGWYTNNPNVLLRYTIKDNSDRHLALILSQFKKSSDLNYTLSCYCTEGFEFSSPIPTLKYQTEISSTWSTYTAGGPIGSDSYHTNPQYSVFVANETESAVLQLSVTTTAATAVNAMLFPVKRRGDKVLNCHKLSIIDTGNYRHGFVVSDRKAIPAGAYTLVVSNFHVGQTGFYTLKVASNLASVNVHKLS